MDEMEAVERSLAPMFEKAEKEGLWFCRDDMCFSPDELREEQACGRFLGGAVNWTLEKPEKRVEAAFIKADLAQKEACELEKRVFFWAKGWSDADQIKG